MQYQADNSRSRGPVDQRFHQAARDAAAPMLRLDVHIHDQSLLADQEYPAARIGTRQERPELHPRAPDGGIGRIGQLGDPAYVLTALERQREVLDARIMK